MNGAGAGGHLFARAMLPNGVHSMTASPRSIHGGPDNSRQMAPFGSIFSGADPFQDKINTATDPTYCVVLTKQAASLSAA